MTSSFASNFDASCLRLEWLDSGIYLSVSRFIQRHPCCLAWRISYRPLARWAARMRPFCEWLSRATSWLWRSSLSYFLSKKGAHLSLSSNNLINGKQEQRTGRQHHQVLRLRVSGVQARRSYLRAQNEENRQLRQGNPLLFLGKFKLCQWDIELALSEPRRRTDWWQICGLRTYGDRDRRNAGRRRASLSPRGLWLWNHLQWSLTTAALLHAWVWPRCALYCSTLSSSWRWDFSRAQSSSCRSAKQLSRFGV